MFALMIVILSATASALAVPPETNDLASSINQFSLELLAKCAEEDKSRNIVISPYSVGTALALSAAGARGATFDEIREALHLSGDKHAIAGQFSVAANELTRNVGNATLKIANKFYVAEDATINKGFNEIAVNNFNSEAETANFGDNVGSAKKINDWVELHTESKIKDLVPAEAISGDTRLVIANAIYFKGTWKNQFEKRLSRPGDFHVSETQTKEATFMKTHAKFKYGDLADLEAKVIELPYTNSDINFLIILPHDVNGLSNLLSKLKNHDLQSVSNQLELEDVIVTIPKFEVTFDVLLNSHLQALGVRKLFNFNADLGDLLEVPEPVYVTSFLHKAYIGVDEEGAEAAASSAVIFGWRTAHAGPLPKSFRADHPFIYAIRKGSTTLFIGNYISP